MKYVIVGRDGTGKTLMANMLSKNGLKLLKTYTTRPKRYPSEDTYHFITPEESAAISDKCLDMEYNGYEYFTRLADVNECDVMILDPTGVYDIAEMLPNESLHIIHMTSNNTVRKNRAENRGEDKERETENFENRDKDPRFDIFETRIAVPVALTPNTSCVHEIENNKDKKAIEDMAHALALSRQMFLNTKNILTRCDKMGLIKKDPKGNFIIEQKDGVNCEVPLEIATDVMISSPKNMHELTTTWLMHETTLPAV